MKRIFLLAALILLTPLLARGQCANTPNIPLQTVNPGAQSGWANCINNDLTIIDSLLGGVTSLALNSTTPSVLNGRTFKASNSSGTAITNFTNGFQGQAITIVCNDALTTFASGSTLDVNTNFNCTGALSGAITFVLQGTVWTEISRSTNAQQYRNCDLVVGDESGSAITNAQLGPQKKICQIPATGTIVQVTVSAQPSSTPSVIVGRRRCTSSSGGVCTAETLVNILSGALSAASGGFDACSNAGGTTGVDGVTTCSSTLQNTALLPGDHLELVSGTAGGTATKMPIHIIWTVNN